MGHPTIDSVAPFTWNIESGINDQLLAVEESWRAGDDFSMAAGNYTLTDDEFRRRLRFNVTGVTAAGRDFTIPNITGPLLVTSDAANTQDFDVVKDTTQIVLSPSETRLFWSGVGANNLVAIDVEGTELSPEIAGRFHPHGAVRRDVTQAIAADTDTVVTYDTVVDEQPAVAADWVDLGSFNTRITIPSGMGIQKAIIGAGVKTSSGSAGANNYIHEWLTKNGGAKPGIAANYPGNTDAGGVKMGFGVRSPVENVVDGDYFEHNIRHDTAITHASSWPNAMFVLPLFAAINHDAPGCDIHADFISGVPGTTTVVFKTVVARDCELWDDFGGSFAHVGTNPSATTTFDIDVNGTTIGTIAFSTTGVATFATTGSGFESLSAGDRLEIITQGSVNSIADIGIALRGRYPV